MDEMREDLRTESTESENEHELSGSQRGSGKRDSAKSRSWVRWTPEEHALLTKLVEELGVNRSWSAIAAQIPGRTGKQCRERWLNHTSADTKKGNWSSKEEYILASEHSVHGSQWCRITRCLPGRTDNSVKNHWNATWRSKVMHKPQSILWLYSTEMKNGLAPQAALRAALLKWENNVPAHQVIETLGFWPSQQYGVPNANVGGGSGGTSSAVRAGKAEQALGAMPMQGIQVQVPSAAGLAAMGPDMMMQGLGQQLTLVKQELQQQPQQQQQLLQEAQLAGPGGSFGGQMIIEMGPNGEVCLRSVASQPQQQPQLQQAGTYVRQLQPQGLQGLPQGLQVQQVTLPDGSTGLVLVEPQQQPQQLEELQQQQQVQVQLEAAGQQLEENGSNHTSDADVDAALTLTSVVAAAQQQALGQAMAAPAAVVQALPASSCQGQVQRLAQLQPAGPTTSGSTLPAGGSQQQLPNGTMPGDRLQARGSIETHTSIHKDPPLSHTSTATPAANAGMASAPASPMAHAGGADHQPRAAVTRQEPQQLQLQQPTLSQPPQPQVQQVVFANANAQPQAVAPQQVSGVQQSQVVTINGQRLQLITSPGQNPQLVAVQMAGAAPTSSGGGALPQQLQQVPQQLQQVLQQAPQPQLQPQQLVWAQGPQGPQLVSAAPANLSHLPQVAAGGAVGDWAAAPAAQAAGNQQVVYLQAPGGMGGNLSQLVQVSAPSGMMLGGQMVVGGQLMGNNGGLLQLQQQLQQPQLVSLPGGGTGILSGGQLQLLAPQEQQQQPQLLQMQVDAGMPNGQEASSRMQPAGAGQQQQQALALPPGAILVQQGPGGMPMLLQQDGNGSATALGLGGGANGSISLPASTLALLQQQQQQGGGYGRQQVVVSDGSGQLALGGGMRTLTLPDLSQQQMMTVQQLLAQQGIHAVMQ